MILKTQLLEFKITRGDAVFDVQELSTDEYTDIAIITREKPEKKIEETFVKAVRGWINIHNPTGPLECNDENKRAIFQANPEFIESVLTEYREKTAELLKDQKKTLPPGQSGISIPKKCIAKNAKN